MSFLVELAFGEGEERLAARPAHRELLQRLHQEGVLRLAGPFADDSGALLIFDVPDEATLEGIVAADPYYTTPGVTVARRQQWSPIVGA